MARARAATVILVKFPGNTYFMRKALSLYNSWAAPIVLLTALTASAQPVHRYSFTANANDSIGTAHGAAAQLSDANGPIGSPVVFQNGEAVLDGIGGYIDLPNGLVSTLTNITIEAWVTVGVNANWARIFDFGASTSSGEVSPSQPVGTGTNYMFLTPNGGDSLNARFTITDAANGGERPILNDTNDFPEAVQAYVAVVYGPPIARLFVNGQQVAAGTAEVPLSALADVNNWLGRSQWADAMFNGSYNEFRIHNTLVGAPELKASSAAGPDALDYDPGTVTAVSITVESQMLTGASQIPQVTATFTKVGVVDISGPDVTLSSSATNVVRVTSTGALSAVGPGSATITASRGGQSGTANITVSPANPAALRHRYSFADAVGSTTVADSVGGQAGTIIPAVPTAAVPNPLPVVLTNGQAFMPSGTTWDSAGYIDLPNGLISSKTNITIETWVTWSGPNNNANQNWSRIFDFGDSSKGEDAHSAGNGGGRGYIFLTPRANGNTLRVEAIPAGGAAAQLNTSPTIAVGQEHHLVIVYAPEFRASRLYVNGILAASGDAAFPLSQLTDINNWLGASQWQGDQPFFGFYNEFRIYEGVLTDLEVALSRNAGPNALPQAPGPLQSISLTAPALMPGNPAIAQASLLANFQNVSNVNIISVAGVALRSTDTNLFTVNATGGLLPRTNIGSASLIATYQNLSATTAVSVLAPTSLRHNLATTTLNAEGAPVNATLLADFPPPGTTNINVNGFAGVTRASSNTNIVTIAANGNVLTFLPGTATITSTYSILTAQTTLTVVTPPGFQPGQLTHRYSFGGQPGTTVVTDSVGTAHGELVGLDPATTNDFNGLGQLATAGSPWNGLPLGAYVNLPNGLVSSLNAVTLEGWANWKGGANAANQRFFDFGMSSGAPDGGGAGVFGEDVVANPGRSYMFLTPSGPRFAINQGTAGENPSITSSIAIAQNTNIHFAVVYDPPNGVARLYINGRRAGTAAATQPLSAVDDRNAWLGRSQWQDPLYYGLFDEFRIYNGPRLDADIAASFAAGPDSIAQPGPTLVAAVVTGNLEITWPSSATGFVLETVSTLGGTWTDAGATLTTNGPTVKAVIPVTGTTGFYRLRK